MQKSFQKRAPQGYRPPEIETVDGLTYNRWGALGVVYGINVPFVSKLAQTVMDEENFRLWSSPKLVLTMAEAHDAYKSGNEQHNRGLLSAAIDYCNQFLPPESQLPESSILRLAWIEHGIASVSCELNRRDNYEMDVVKHGPNTFILNAPKPTESHEEDTRMQTQYLFTQTGSVREPRPSREPRRDSRSPLNPNRKAGNFGGRRGYSTI